MNKSEVNSHQLKKNSSFYFHKAHSPKQHKTEEINTTTNNDSQDFKLEVINFIYILLYIFIYQHSHLGESQEEQFSF